MGLSRSKVSKVGPSSGESWVLAPAYTAPSGIPRASVTVERLRPPLAAVHRAPPGVLAAAGGLGDTAVHGQVTQVQADHAVVGGQDQQLESGEQAELDPFVAAVADGGGRAGRIGDLAVAAAEHQGLDELVEDDPVGDAGAVAAKRVVGVVGGALGQQRAELVPQWGDEPRFQRRAQALPRVMEW
jgi:hypothetical protein